MGEKSNTTAANNMVDLIRELIQQELIKEDNTATCRIMACNPDGSYDINVLPDMVTVVRSVKSISPENLKEGDYAYIFKFKNKLNNAVIIAKIGGVGSDVRFLTARDENGNVVNVSGGPFLPLTGGTLTGNLEVSPDSQSHLHVKVNSPSGNAYAELETFTESLVSRARLVLDDSNGSPTEYRTNEIKVGPYILSFPTLSADKTIATTDYVSGTNDGTNWTNITIGSNTYAIPSGNPDTWRNIKVDGVQLLGTSPETGYVNFKSGDNVTVAGSGHDITISATNSYHAAGSWNNTLTYTFDRVGGAPALSFTIPTGDTSTTVARGDHTHSINLAASAGTQSITLAYDQAYQLTAGGSSLIFKMPASDNTDHYHTPVYTSAANSLKLGTGTTGLSDMYIPYATTSQAGVVSTGVQSFAGAKTFTNTLTVDTGDTTSMLVLGQNYSMGQLKFWDGADGAYLILQADPNQAFNNQTLYIPSEATGRTLATREWANGNFLSVNGGTATGDFVLNGAGGESITFNIDGTVVLRGYGSGDSGGVRISSQSGSSAKYGIFKTTNLTADHTYELPNSDGVLALLGDIKDGILTISGNGTSVTTFSANQNSPSSLNIKGSGDVSVTADPTNHEITISAQFPSFPVTDVKVGNTSVVTNTVALLGTAAGKDFTTSVTSGSNALVTSGAVFTAISDLPKAMIFRGTLGTGGTITDLPTASATTEGDVYKVITAGTYASQTAKVGDVFICGLPTGSSTYSWILIPAGDTDTDTWRSIKINNADFLGTGISSGAVNFKNGNNVTITGSGNDITIAATNSYHKTGSWNGLTYTATNVNTNDNLAFTIPTGTTSTTVAAGDHKHDDRYVRFDVNNQGLNDTQKGNARTNIGAGTYSKPAGGIPDGDLATAYLPLTASSSKPLTGTLYVKGSGISAAAATSITTNTSNAPHVYITGNTGDSGKVFLNSLIIGDPGANGTSTFARRHDTYGTYYNRTYTLPDATGEFILDSNAQTISGLKTFSNANGIAFTDSHATGYIKPYTYGDGSEVPYESGLKLDAQRVILSGNGFVGSGVVAVNNGTFYANGLTISRGTDSVYFGLDNDSFTSNGFYFQGVSDSNSPRLQPNASGYGLRLPNTSSWSADRTVATTSDIKDGTLSIQGNGTTASTFTANQSSNTTLNIKGGGITSVTKSANNEITITSTEADTLASVTGRGATTSTAVIMSGGLDVTGNNLKLNKISAPTSSGGNTYGTGSANQVLKADGNGGVYWASDSNTNTWRDIQVDGSEKLSTRTDSGALNFISQNLNNGDVTFTYDSVAKGIKATAKIPTALKNPNAIKFQGGGQDVTSYDGSAAKTINIAASQTAGAFTISDGTTTRTIQLAGTFTDNNQKVKAGNVTFSDNDTVNFVGSGIVTVTGDATNDTITISASHQSIKSLDTTATTAQSTNSNEAIAGTGKITLHKVAKTGTYSDLIGKPSIPTKDSDLTNDRYVRFDTASQGLTTTQKQNARINIDAAAGTHYHDGRYVRFDTDAQGLSDTQKQNARTNIGAGAPIEIVDLTALA